MEPCKGTWSKLNITSYELRVDGERGGLELYDFTSLRATGAAAAPIVERAEYGRQECVADLVAAAAAAPAPPPASLVTVRQGRNAQRLLDALLASNGEWADVDLDE